MVFCRHGRAKNQLVWTRLGYSLIRDPEGSGGLRGICLLWGSKVHREPTNEGKWALVIDNCELLGSRPRGLCHVRAQDWAHITGFLLLDWTASPQSGGGYSFGATSWEEHYWVCGVPLSTWCSCQGHDYPSCWYREARDTGYCHSCATGPGKPSIPPHKWWVGDVGWECFGWDLLGWA